MPRQISSWFPQPHPTFTHTHTPSTRPFTPSASEPGAVSNGVATPIDAPRPAERVRTRPSEGPSAGDCGKSDLWCPRCCWPVTSASSLFLFPPLCLSIVLPPSPRPPSVTYLFNFLKLQNIYENWSRCWLIVLDLIRENLNESELHLWTIRQKSRQKGSKERMGKGLLGRKGLRERGGERKDDFIS